MDLFFLRLNDSWVDHCDAFALGISSQKESYCFFNSLGGWGSGFDYLIDLTNANVQ